MTTREVLALLGASGPKGTWTPASMSGLKLWLDASDSATITESSGAVSQWDDKSATGMDFSQSTAGAKPTTGSTTQNGLNVLAFDGGDYLLRNKANSAEWSFLHDGTSHLLAVVAKKGTTGNQGLLSSMRDGTGRAGMWLYMPGTTMRHDVNGISNATVVSNTVTSYLATGTPFLTTVLGDPDNATASARSSLFKNAGTAATNNTATGVASVGRNVDSDMFVGTLMDTLYWLNGWIAEIVAASGADATEDNRVLLRDYLNAKWGIY